MDESVKRRERLKAMQSEASSQGGAVPLHDFGNSASPPLSYLWSCLMKGPSPPHIPPSPSYHQLPPPYSPSFRMPQVCAHFFTLPQQQYGIPPGMRSPYGPMNSARGNSSSPYHSGHDRGPWHNSGNHHSSSNMGRGQGRCGNFVRPDGGWTRSRNQSAEVAPGLYYDKSSVEDPWKFLMPVTWEGRKCLIMESSSISMVLRNGLVMDQVSAEFLADSFSEAAV
ncbi:protein SICKLE-like [Impatiens glandulifera]|uniref:protein SICKLE-like n=1 Tax=Impatiens glandulifera TaxID=253017 RepID=UPI001FB0B90C|nr:protein SICKLE-like [Impatiens glandulifera]